ncbi:MAG: hypothetical protein EXS05_22815 [Planctomycetaceae bacterium]|nr:hypothetical protein [Planctomycetaceae bacterium]
MPYRAVATSLEGFVQQIACCYLRHGYWFYVTGHIPAEKDPTAIDRKLLETYGIEVSESTRARRKRLGQANLQYLRHERMFAILATKGQHEFFTRESKSIHDLRHVPLKYGGYAISYRRGGRSRSGEADPRWHAHVEIERRRYLELKAWLLDLATHRSVDQLALAFYRLPFEPYAPIRRQLLNIWRAVNRARKVAGFQPVPVEVIPFRRRIVRPFANPLRQEIAPPPTVAVADGKAEETSADSRPHGK